jgi:hypothetical protein
VVTIQNKSDSVPNYFIEVRYGEGLTYDVVVAKNPEDFTQQLKVFIFSFQQFLQVIPLTDLIKVFVDINPLLQRFSLLNQDFNHPTVPARFCWQRNKARLLGNTRFRYLLQHLHHIDQHLRMRSNLGFLVTYSRHALCQQKVFVVLQCLVQHLVGFHHPDSAHADTEVT